MSKTLTVSDEVWDKIKETVNEDTESFEVEDLEDFVGEKLFIRTVTYHLVGKVKRRVRNLFELEGASWIADSGRFMDAIKKGTLSEVEPVGKCWVNISSITDMFPWKHDLPKEQK